ncbi:hypothetical protein ABIB66_008737 [Bradyrhizobium sp. F1.13.3]
MVAVGGYAAGTIEGHTIPMTEVGCNEIRALHDGRQRYSRVNRLSQDFVKQKKFPELRVEVRPIGHHLSVRKICRSGIDVGGKGRKSVPPPPGQKPAEETS